MRGARVHTPSLGTHGAARRHLLHPDARRSDQCAAGSGRLPGRRHSPRVARSMGCSIVSHSWLARRVDSGCAVPSLCQLWTADEPPPYINQPRASSHFVSNASSCCDHHHTTCALSRSHVSSRRRLAPAIVAMSALQATHHPLRTEEATGRRRSPVRSLNNTERHIDCIPHSRAWSARST